MKIYILLVSYSNIVFLVKTCKVDVSHDDSSYMLNSTEIKLVILADYTRYKAKYNQTQAIVELEHVPINEIYFSFYRIAGTDQLFESTLKTYFNPFFSLHLDTFWHLMACWFDFFDR